MSRKTRAAPQAAEVVLPCAELRDTLAFFTDRLGFRVDEIFPAEDPSVAVVSGYGLRLRFVRGAVGAPGTLRLLCRDPAAFADGAGDLTAPNGTRIELVSVDSPLALPPLEPSFVVQRMRGVDLWVEGRAGMRYRDLVPGRQGGRFVASHIQIADAGPVPDYVHFHRVCFQAIYCWKGWVKVVYEDQGSPFLLRAGDCVLQPPEIRHRVLQSSAGLEVIEISSPALHETLADHELALPTATANPDRVFGGQRFVRHEAAGAAWNRPGRGGFEARETGIAAATGGVAGILVLRYRGPAQTQTRQHDGETLFTFVLGGAATLRCAGRDAERLAEGDSFVVPAGLPYALADCADDFELLEVSMGDLSALRAFGRPRS